MKLTAKIILLGLILSLSSCGDEELKAEIERQKKEIADLKATIEKLENCVISPLDEPVDRVKLSIELDEFSGSYYNFFKMRKEMQNAETAGSLPLNQLKSLFLTEGIWFDYNLFKEYIAFIDKNAQEANIDISGLRFFPSISREERKMTLVYNPTIREGNGHFSYALQKEGNEVKPVLLKDIIPGFLDLGKKQQGNLLSFLSSSNTNDVQSQAGNRGQLSPPPSDILDENQ